MINISSHDLFFTYSCCTKAGSSESVEWENNRRRSQSGLSRLGIICASFTPHHLRGTRYNATFARGETWWRRQGSARRPQEFGIHKIFVRHLRNVQMMPKWRPNDRPLVSFKEDTVRMFPRLIFVVFVEQGSIQHKVDHFLPPPPRLYSELDCSLQSNSVHWILSEQNSLNWCGTHHFLR